MSDIAWLGDHGSVVTTAPRDDPNWGWAFGWFFRAWQYRAGRPDDEVPWWSGVNRHNDGTATCMDHPLPEGYWVLARVGDPGPYGMVSDEHYTTWFRQA